MKKKVKVVMLPTEKAENSIVKSAGKLWYFEGLFTQDYLQSQGKKSHHLYLVSDEEIKGKGFRIDMDRMTCGVIDDDNYYNDPKNGNYKKVIATTDKSLEAYKTAIMGGKEHTSKRPVQLPQIPESFIKAYVEVNGEIDEVMVEYETGIDWQETSDVNRKSAKQTITLKTREDNTVIISPIKTKKTEALDFLKKLHIEWGENWDMIIDMFGQDIADEWDKICGYDKNG